MNVNYPIFGSNKALVPMLILMSYPININNQRVKLVEKHDVFVKNPIETVDEFDYQQPVDSFELRAKDVKAYEEKQKMISDIIEKDKSSPRDFMDSDRKKLAEFIINVSEISGIDYDIITFIAQSESHFNQNLSGESGKGLMQITSIVPKDMFQRPAFYDENLKPMIKEYGSLEKLFEAKDLDNSLDLGKFGEFLYMHKTPENLIQDCINDAQTNLITGAFCFKAKLKSAGGNIFNALADYNSTSTKNDYAKDIYNKIMKFKHSLNYTL